MLLNTLQSTGQLPHPNKELSIIKVSSAQLRRPRLDCPGLECVGHPGLTAMANPG
jgi:hypothetical protein